jgi:hypothetical protein
MMVPSHSTLVELEITVISMSLFDMCRVQKALYFYKGNLKVIQLVRGKYCCR